MRSAIVTLAVMPFVLACASAGSTSTAEPVRRNERLRMNETETINLTHDVEISRLEIAAGRMRVWNAALESLKALAFPLTESNAATGRLMHWNNDAKHAIAGKQMSRYFDCGNGPTGPRADTYRLSIKVIQAIDSVSANSTRLSTELQAVARRDGMSGDALHCNSTGQFEALLTAMIMARVQ